MIDSEQVPWGKGEKHPGKGDEIVSETIYLQRVGACRKTGDGVPIEEWANDFIVCGLTNPPCAEQSKWKRGLIARFLLIGKKTFLSFF